MVTYFVFLTETAEVRGERAKEIVKGKVQQYFERAEAIKKIVGTSKAR